MPVFAKRKYTGFAQSKIELANHIEAKNCGDIIAVYFYHVEFSFKAEIDGLMITLTAERIYRSKQSERYQLTITGTNYKIAVQTNRPAIEKKDGKAVQWHIAEGTASDKTKLDNLYKQLEKAIANQPASFQGTLNFIDHF